MNRLDNAPGNIFTLIGARRTLLMSVASSPAGASGIIRHARDRASRTFGEEVSISLIRPARQGVDLPGETGIGRDCQTHHAE